MIVAPFDNKSNVDQSNHKDANVFMVFILLFCMVLLQYALQFWRVNDFRTYFKTTLFLTWIVPFIMSIFKQYVRMIILWIIYSVGVSYLYIMVRRKPLKINTPRFIYLCYYFAHMISELIVILSSVVFFVLLFLPALPLFDSIVQNTPYFMFYGLYFGLLTRDIACLLTDVINIRLGMVCEREFPKTAVSSNICPLCGLVMVDYPENGHLPIIKSMRSMNVSAFIESEQVVTLDCSHRFHDFCIRGWLMIGKKETCPHCREKANLRQRFITPWEKANLYYGDFINILRYLLAWHPLLAAFIYVIYKLTGLN